MLCTRLFAPPAPANASAPSSSAIVRSLGPTGISGSVKLVAKSPQAAPSVASTTAITTKAMIATTMSPISFSTVW